MSLTNKPGGVSNSGGKMKLSDRLKNMRFMKTREEAEIRSKFEKEQRDREKATHWTLETESGHKNDNDNLEENYYPLVIIEDGNMINDEECIGRKSYGKFNTFIEKRNRSKLNIAEEEDDDHEDDVKVKEQVKTDESKLVSVSNSPRAQYGNGRLHTSNYRKRAASTGSNGSGSAPYTPLRKKGRRNHRHSSNHSQQNKT